MRVVDEAFPRCTVKWQTVLYRDSLPYSCMSENYITFSTISDGELEMSLTRSPQISDLQLTLTKPITRKERKTEMRLGAAFPLHVGK